MTGTLRTTGINAGRLDTLFISPQNQRFRSQKDVLTHLGLQRPASAEATSGQPFAPKPFDPSKTRDAKVQARLNLVGVLLCRTA